MSKSTKKTLKNGLYRVVLSLKTYASCREPGGWLFLCLMGHRWPVFAEGAAWWCDTRRHCPGKRGAKSQKRLKTTSVTIGASVGASVGASKVGIKTGVKRGVCTDKRL